MIDYDSALERKAVPTLARTWMDLEDLGAQRHKPDTEGQVVPRFTRPHMGSLEEPHPQRQTVVGGARDWEWGWGVSVRWGQSFNLGRWKVLDIDGCVAM